MTTEIYRIVYKLNTQGSKEQIINIDFEEISEANKILNELRETKVFKNTSYSFLRSFGV